MPSVGSLFASLTLESASFMSGIKAAQKEMLITQRKFASVGAGLAKTGAALTAGITAPFTALIATSIPAATESAQAAAQVNAALKSMGPVAGRTADQLQGLAGHLQDISVFDDDDILKSVTANLLTFGKVSGDVFDRAEGAIVDISARMGTDLQSATIMVGKALNDPIKGMKALGRAGIQFSDDQKAAIMAMVETGNVAGAQKVMLSELERQFGGAAKAQRDATPGAASQQAWRTLQETLGGIGLKVLPPLVSVLTTVLNALNNLSPTMQVIVVGTAAFAAAIGPVLVGVGGMVTAVGALLPVIVAVATALTATAIPAVISFGAIMLPILAPLAAVAGAVALVVAAVNHWDQIKAVASRVVGYMAGLYNGVKAWLGDKLGAVFDFVGQKVKAVGDFFYKLYDRVVGHSYVPDMVDGIAAQLSRLDKVMVDPARVATETVADHFRQLASDVAPIMDRLFPEAAALNRFNADLAKLNEGQAAGLIDGQASSALISERFMPDIDALSDKITAAGEEVMERWDGGSGVVPKLKAANDNLGQSFADTATSIAQSLGGLANSIKRGDWLGAIQGVVDVLTKLGSIGVFGKSIAANVNKVPARASGGPISAGRPYLVGERGPELVVPSTGGTVIPNHALRGGVANNNRPVTFDMRGAVMTSDLLAQMNLIAAGRSNIAIRGAMGKQSAQAGRRLA